MCSLQRNYDVILNWARFETGPLTVLEFTSLDGAFVSSPVVFASSVMFFVSSIVSPVGLLDSIQLLD